MCMTKEHEGKHRGLPNESVGTVSTISSILYCLFRTELMKKKTLLSSWYDHPSLDALPTPSRHVPDQPAIPDPWHSIPPSAWAWPLWSFVRFEVASDDFKLAVGACTTGVLSDLIQVRWSRRPVPDIDSFLIQVPDPGSWSGIILH